MQKIPEKFVQKLLKSPETEMGIRTTTVWTKDGRRFDNIEVSDAENILGIYGYPKLPFNPDDIADVEVTDFIKPADYDPTKWTRFA